MKTLYDLLGALPEDDAEDLRAAFRVAAKRAHPDLNPADSDAALRFRRLVRANEILSDPEQRAAYDHLLHLAGVEQDAPQKCATPSGWTPVARACGVIALATGASLVITLAGLFMLDYAIPPSTAQMNRTALHVPSQATSARIDLANPNPISSTDRETESEVGDPKNQDESHEDLNRMEAASLVTAAQGTLSDPLSSSVPAIRDFGTNDAKHYRQRGISAYHSGDLYLALADFALAIQFDPSFRDAYIDRAIVFNRIGDQKRAFADLQEAKRIHRKFNQPRRSPVQAHANSFPRLELENSRH